MADMNTKKLTEVSLLSALTLVLMIICLALQGFSLVLGVFAPLPIVILCIKYDYISGSEAAIFSIIAASAMFTIPIALPTGVLFWTAGLILGLSAKKNMSFKSAFLLLTAAVLFSFILDLIIYTLLVDKNGLIGIIRASVDELKGTLNAVSSAAALIGNLGYNTENLSYIKYMADFISVDNILIYVPIAFIIMSAIYAYFIYTATAAVLKRIRYGILKSPSITALYIDYWFVIVLFIVFVSGYLLSWKGYAAGKYIYMTDIYLAAFSFGLQGFSAAAYFFIKRLRTPRILAIIILLVPILLNLLILYACTGIVDMLLDLRKVYHT